MRKKIWSNRIEITSGRPWLACWIRIVATRAIRELHSDVSAHEERIVELAFGHLGILALIEVYEGVTVLFECAVSLIDRAEAAKEHYELADGGVARYVAHEQFRIRDWRRRIAATTASTTRRSNFYYLV